MTELIKDRAYEYAPHLNGLIGEMDKWVLRRVVFASIVSADSLQVHESVDFDLRASPAGEVYLEEVKNKHLELVIPIGLYDSPFVAFDLRGDGEQRLSLLTGPTRDALRNETKLHATESWVSGLLGDKNFAIMHVPCEYGEKRHVVHYSYMTEFREGGRYKWDPSKGAEKKRGLSLGGGACWIRKQVGSSRLPCTPPR
jgi:hypothetical protein